ncbi:MAG: hypothetical protein IPL03_13620 [Sterolibacteriaceae bacterium]|nr:hypothetical protein [Candidatus Methylophosphatis haderslevensis]
MAVVEPMLYAERLKRRDVIDDIRHVSSDRFFCCSTSTIVLPSIFTSTPSIENAILAVERDLRLAGLDDDVFAGGYHDTRQR